MAPIEKDFIAMRISTFVSAIALGVLVSGVAYALDAAAPADPAAAEAAAAKKAKSEDCYKQADVKGLHGKERKKFHRECVEGKAK
ncbi:MAG: PsiF family protein [Roseiarcus sp.]|jgi:hypothetical protein